MVKVSVIIPCYNAGGYIGRCLDSMQAQTFTEFEVICVDDCSTDNTEEVIKSYVNKSARIAYLRNEHNSGPAKSRINGISVAKGEFVAFCDSDDWFNSDSLKTMYETAITYKSDIVCFGNKIVFDKGRTIEHPVTEKTIQLRSKEAVMLNLDALWSMMVKKSLVERFPMPDIRNGEDMAVIPLYFAYSRNVSVIPALLYNYYVRSNSLSSKANLGILKSFEISFLHTKGAFPKDLNKELEYIGIRNYLYGSLLTLFKCGYDKKTACRIIDNYDGWFKNWRMNPYRNTLPLFKRIYVQMASKKLYGAMWVLSKLHSMIVKYS